ncbi:MAG: hypothetical protein RIC14_02945 [Filomicrobium sp.]
MPQLRTSLSYVCCAVLVWMSVAAGLATVAAKSHLAEAPYGSAVGAGHSHSSHSQSEASHTPTPLAVGEATVNVPADGPGRCIATCLDLISDKLPPKILAENWQPEQVWSFVEYGHGKAALVSWHATPRFYWPTGPPRDRFASANGAARVVALNARLRI